MKLALEYASIHTVLKGIGEDAEEVNDRVPVVTGSSADNAITAVGAELVATERVLHTVSKLLTVDREVGYRRGGPQRRSEGESVARVRVLCS
jgi:hypothetical protein